MDDLLQEFIAETRETLEALSGEIVAWEAAPADRARLDAIFRFVHTVKGSCGFLDLPRLARLSHAAEDVLAEVRDGTRHPDRGLVNAVLAIVDRIGEIVEAIDAGLPLDDSGEDLLIAALAEGTDAVAIVPHSTTPQRTAQRSVRLNVDLLDRMMSGMSDMVLARNELARRLRDLPPDPGVEAALERLSTSVADMRDTVTRTRMQKIEALFSPLPRIVRDTAATVGKSVTLQIEGGDVELDREMIEVMRDPLVHIVRNAIDHGIEGPADRAAAGKRQNGRLLVSARQSGNQIVIEIVDDGRGIDVDRLVRKAAAAGIRDERALREMSPAAQAELVFEPGLSSRDTVTAISGRGVGMDVVRAAIDQIGGRITLDNAPGQGLRLVIHVPLTLSIISTIVVGVADHRFAIPRQAIEEIVAARGDNIRVDTLGGTPVATVRGRRLPLVHLSQLLGLDAGLPHVTMLAIVGIGTGSFALAVDAVLDTEELVVKPAAPAVMATGVYAGQTLPDSGCPMLLLDCAGVASAAGLRFERALREIEAEECAAEAPAGTPGLMFVDLDGERRVVALAAVDRIERVPASAIRSVAGRLRITLDGALVPVVTCAPIAGDRRELALLRLRDGAGEVAYAVEDAVDIVAMPDALVPALRPGIVAGAILLGDMQVERIDPFWLFANHLDAGPAIGDERPLCVLAGPADGWLATFLGPILEQSGYRTAAQAGGDRPVAVLCETDVPPEDTASAPVIRLRRTRDAAVAGDDSIYRYDRDALLAALARTAVGGA